jgi:hypothetical protein
MERASVGLDALAVGIGLPPTGQRDWVMFLRELLLLAFAFGPIILAAVFSTWKTYEVYKALGDRARGLGFQWFSYLWRNEWMRKNLGYPDPLEGAPNDVRTLATRNQAKIRTVGALMLWWIVLIILAAIIASVHQAQLSKAP